MRYVIFMLFSPNEQRGGGWGGGGGGGGAANFLFHFIFSQFSRPRAGLATMQSTFFGLETNILNLRNNNNSSCDRLLLFVYFQVNNGVVYLDYEDSHHHDPLLCSFQ